MIIDIVSPYSVQLNCFISNHTESMIALSADKAKIRRLSDEYPKQGFSDSIKSMVFDDETEITIINVNFSSHEVYAFRSVTSHYELFYYIHNNQLIITDHMINMLSYIPVSERSVDLDGVCDTFLYQHNYGTHTSVKDVWRLSLGEELCFSDGKASTKIVQKLELNKYPEFSERNGSDVLADLLSESVRTMEHEDSLNTLSGGVDSSLTQFYMKNKNSVSSCYDYEGFQCERLYAEEAAKLLGSKHHTYNIKMSDYFDTLTDTIKTFGLSTYNMTAQILHYTLGKNVPQSHMFLSEAAGAVYGLGMRKPLTDDLRLAYPMEHRFNYANMYGEIARLDDIAYIRKIFGDDIVDSSLDRRNRYVLDRVKNFDTADNSYDNFIQLAHLSYYLTNNAISTDEQVEMVFGKTLNTPYSSRKLVEGFLSLKLHERYENKQYGEKPYAKILLEKICPGYEVNKNKLGGSLPRTYMVTDGPLGGYFKKHDIPDFIVKDIREEFINPSWNNSWGVKYTIMHNIWYENVFLKNINRHNSKWIISNEY